MRLYLCCLLPAKINIGRMNEFMSGADELWYWLHTLEPGFAFLLALPFIVVAAGLGRYWFD